MDIELKEDIKKILFFVFTVIALSWFLIEFGALLHIIAIGKFDFGLTSNFLALKNTLILLIIILVIFIRLIFKIRGVDFAKSKTERC